MFKFYFAENATNWQAGFQVPASPVMEGIVNLHHDLFFFLVVICTVVSYMIFRCIVQYNSETIKKPLVVVHAPTLEIIWTLIPAIILIFVAIPSFSLLYSIDELIEPLFTLKVIGHQWYWSYEFLDPNILFWQQAKANSYAVPEKIELNCNFDSYMLSDEMRLEEAIKKTMASFNTTDAKSAGVAALANKAYPWVNASEASEEKGLREWMFFLKSKKNATIEYMNNNIPRLLSVDNKIFLPIETNVRILITAADVLHCWAVPALGVKLDACPGRLNQTSVYIKRPGIFYGQCSEICGVNHGFMPIAVVGLDILGDGSKLTVNTAESILPIYTALLGKLYDLSE